MSDQQITTDHYYDASPTRTPHPQQRPATVATSVHHPQHHYGRRRQNEHRRGTTSSIVPRVPILRAEYVI
jgi:hypothetical protein